MDAGLLRRVRQPPLAGAVPAPTEVAVDEGPAPPLAMGPICLEEDRENDRAAMAQGCRPPSAIRGRIEGSPSSTQAKSRIHCRACTDSLRRRASGDRRPYRDCGEEYGNTTSYSAEGTLRTLRPCAGTLLRTQRLRQGSQFLTHPSLNACTNKSVPPRRKMWA